MDPVIDHTIRLALRLLFLAAVVHKVRDMGAFRETLAVYHVLPRALVSASAVLVVAAELAVQPLLGGWRGLALAGTLLLVYAVAIAINLVRGRDRIDCGCVGVAGRDGLSWWLVARNAACALLAFTALAPATDRPLGAVDALTVLAATGALAALYVAADGLIGNAPAYRRLREAV